MKGFALVDRARSGVENMALDQRMLEVAGEQQCVLVRVYQWSEPTVSLGYFQPYAQRLAHLPSTGLATVRRATGGGAIVHHFDWTYCVAIPGILAAELSKVGDGKRERGIGAAVSLYDCIHDEVVVWLQEHGIPAAKWSSACQASVPPAMANRQPPPFLCFERRNCGDIVLGQHKVMGSAQRRGSGAVLQHGSLLLEASPLAPHLTGLQDWKVAAEIADAQAPNNPRIFLQRILAALQSTIAVDFKIVPSYRELPFSWHWPFECKYADFAWTHRL